MMLMEVPLIGDAESEAIPNTAYLNILLLNSNQLTSNRHGNPWNWWTTAKFQTTKGGPTC